MGIAASPFLILFAAEPEFPPELPDTPPQSAAVIIDLLTACAGSAPEATAQCRHSVTTA
jgi:hypothetical protein